MLNHSSDSSFNARSDTGLPDASLVQLLIAEAVTAKYLGVALTTLLVYHSIIRMDKEVKHFWANPRNSVSLIYFANRYVGLIAAISDIIGVGLDLSLSRVTNWMFLAGNWITIVMIEYILVIRVLALYSYEKRLNIFLKSVWALTSLAALGILIYSIPAKRLIVINVAENINICTMSARPPQVLVVTWIITIVHGVVLMCLALYKAADYWRSSAKLKGYYLIRVLIQDQVFYFVFIIACAVARIITSTSQNPSIVATGFMNAFGSPTILCLIGGELLISLKEAAERGANEGTSFRMSTISEIQFT